MNYEIIGTIATVIVLISFLMNNEKKIRAVNAVGAFIFIVYAYLSKATSVLLLNVCLVIIQLYKLNKLTKESK